MSLHTPHWTVAAALALAFATATPAAIASTPLAGGLPTTTSTAPAAAPANPLDYSHALRLTPPFVASSQADAATADDSLTDQLEIDVCRYDNGGCTALAPITTIRRGLNKQYSASWPASGVTQGQTFRFTWRAAGLNLGSVQMRAGAITDVGRTGVFPTGVPLQITFSVAQQPVITARALHQRGANAIDVAQNLQSAFGLGDADALTILYRDVRTQDVPLPAPSADSLRSGSSTTATTPSYHAFSLGAVADGVASATTFGDTAKQVAALLKGRTPVGNQTTVNALLASQVLQDKGLSPGAMLDVIRGTLGVTDRVASLGLLKGAQSDDGTPLFNSTNVLQAIREIDGTTSLLAALQQLADIGFPASDAARAAQNVGLLPGDAGPGVPALSAAGLQVGEFSGTDLTNALASVYPGLGDDAYTGALKSAANGLIDGACAAYRSAPDAGSIPALLAGKSDVVGPADVVRRLAGSGSRCGFSPTDAATALHYVYTHADGTPAAEATDIASALLAGLPDTPATSALTALGHTLHDAAGVPTDKLACLATTGTVLGAAKVPGLPDGTFGVANVLGALDGTSDASQLFPDPFDPGAGGNLDALGKCLVGGGVVPPFPLRKLTVSYDSGLINAVNGHSINGEELVGRAGWTPNISVPQGAPLFNALKGVQVPSLPALNGPLKNALTVPVLAAGGPTTKVSDGSEDYHTAYPFGDKRGNFQQALIPRAGSNLSSVFGLNGAPAISFLNPSTAPSAIRNGQATFVVPALPGSVTLEGTMYGNNNASCSAGSTVLPGLMAAAIAAPRNVYGAIPGAGTDIWASMQDTTITLPDGPNQGSTYSQPWSASMIGNDHNNLCAIRTVRDNSILGDDSYGTHPFLAGRISVSPLASVGSTKELNDLVANTAGTLQMPGGASAPNGVDYTLGKLPLGGVSNPASAAGNFLSLLAAAGGPALNGGQLTNLLTSGWH